MFALKTEYNSVGLTQLKYHEGRLDNKVYKIVKKMHVFLIFLKLTYRYISPY